MSIQNRALSLFAILASSCIALLLYWVYCNSSGYREAERLLNKAKIVYINWSENGIEDIAELKVLAKLTDDETLSRNGDTFHLSNNDEYEIVFGKFLGFSIKKKDL